MTYDRPLRSASNASLACLLIPSSLSGSTDQYLHLRKHLNIRKTSSGDLGSWGREGGSSGEVGRRKFGEALGHGLPVQEVTSIVNADRGTECALTSLPEDGERSLSVYPLSVYLG